MVKVGLGGLLHANRGLRAGAVVLLVLAFSGVVVPFVSPYLYSEIDLQAIKQPPSVAHWMGTDELGRDLGTRLMIGARISLAIGLAGALVATVLGAGIGALAGYYGGWLEGLTMRAVDLLLAVPILPVLIVISAFTRPSVEALVLLVAAFTWMQTARLVRGAFLSLKEQEFAEAARAVGASDRRIVFLHLLPNAIAPISVASALLVGRVIVMESVLSFLGLGVQPPMPSWGNLLYGAQNYLATEPWLATFPGVFIFLAVLGVNLLGDGLREALLPELSVSATAARFPGR
jgi:peptide/nickel transport system permease protein